MHCLITVLLSDVSAHLMYSQREINPCQGASEDFYHQNITVKIEYK